MINEDKMKLASGDLEMIQALIHLLEPTRQFTLVLSKSKYPTRQQSNANLVRADEAVWKSSNDGRLMLDTIPRA
jgi:hypothetical protein